jgi:chromatin assembly factor 1 subunit B
LKRDVTQPAFMLPGIKSYATCIKFSPYLYKKQVTNNFNPERPPLLDLPYRLVFAVATVDQVLIYSTECVYPLAVVGNIHYASINDMTWI